jgi:hypothetical protein
MNSQELCDVLNRWEHIQDCVKCKQKTKHSHSPLTYDPTRRVMRFCTNCGSINVVILVGKSYCRSAIKE